MQILKVENLYKSFAGSGEVVTDVSFEINEGEVIAVIGPSGSGKSTLLRCLTLLERVDYGTIKVAGETMVETTSQGRVIYASEEQLRKIRLRLGMVFQNFNLFPHFSVLRNITEAPIHVQGLSAAAAKEAAEKLLA